MKPVDHRDAVTPRGDCRRPERHPDHLRVRTGIRTVEEHAAADIAARPTTPPPTTRQGG